MLVEGMKTVSTERRKKVLIGLTLLGLWVAFLWRAFGNDVSFALFMDNEFFIGPVFSAMSAALANGEWPLRMDTILGGVPLYNFAQLSALYPFYFVTLPIYETVLDVVRSMHLVTLLHLLVFEINLYIFLRVLGGSRLAALTGAALIAFSANSFGYAVWLSMVASYAWLPLYLAGLVGMFQFPTARRYLIMAVCGIVLLTLATPAQPLIHAVLLTIIFAVAYSLHLRREGQGGQIRRTLLSILAVAVIAILLTAPVILPVAFEFKNMIRWIGPFPAVIGNARIPFAAFQFDQLGIADLGGIFFRFKGAAVGHQFVGIVALALAGIAVISRPRRWFIIPLAGIALYSLISSTGSNMGLAYLNYHIPLLNKIREPSRFLFLFQFAIGSLAVIGIDELRKAVMQTPLQHELLKRSLKIIGLTAIVAVIPAVMLRKQIVSTLPSFLLIAALVLLALLTWGVARTALQQRGTVVALAWSAAALVLLAVEVPWKPFPVAASQYLTSGAPTLDTAIERITHHDPTHEYRVIFEGNIDKQLATMLASYRGVRTLGAYFNPAPYRQFEELYHHGPRKDNYLRALGAKYLICKECPPEAVQGYRFLESAAGYAIYEAEDVLPYSYISRQVTGTFTTLGEFVEKTRLTTLASKPLFVQPDALPALAGMDETGQTCFMRQVTRTTNHVRFELHCPTSAVLVINTFYDPAWVTSVDGVPSTALRVNGNQIGTRIPAGPHLVDFRFRPRIFYVALGLTGVGIIVLGVVLRMTRKRETDV